MTVPTTIRFEKQLKDAIERVQVDQSRGSLSETIKSLTVLGLETQGIYRCEAACVELGIFLDRADFGNWCVENDVPIFGTLHEWEHYYESFEIDRDGGGYDTTETESLAVPQ